jgi:hypothetical protein
MPTRTTRPRASRSVSLVGASLAVLAVSVACTPEAEHAALQKTVTIFGNRAPASTASDPDSAAVELGVRFRTKVPGFITSVRFYKTDGNTGTHTGTLWSAAGTRLATGTFKDESLSGWQELFFSAPVRINANTTYLASYHAPHGHYAAQPGGLANSASNGPIAALAHGVDGPNSVYTYGDTTNFPKANWLSANYWIDVRFAPEGAFGGVTPTTGAPTSTTAAATTTIVVAPTTTLPAGPGKPTGAVQPAGGLALRAVDGGPGYYGRWANSLPTDASFFPIAVYNETLDNPADTAAKYKAIGVNGFVGVWNGMSPAISGALKANGQWAFTMPQTNGAPGYGREWAGYEFFDEADGHNVCGDVGWLGKLCTGGDRTDAAAIKNMANAIRGVDGSRPTFGQYTKPVALGQGLDEATRKAYIDAVDIVSYDFYPISDPWENNRNLWDQADAVNQVRTLAGRSKPVFVFIETSKLFGDKPVGKATPTPAQIQAQVWHAIIGGARGIEYFNHNFSGDPTNTQHLLIDPTYAAVAQAVGRTNAQIQALAPVLNAPYVDNVLTVASGQVNSMAKYHDGAAYLFVGSRSKSSQQVSLKVNGITNGVATVVDENRTVPISNGVLNDTFAGETAVHIYKIG